MDAQIVPRRVDTAQRNELRETQIALLRALKEGLIKGDTPCLAPPTLIPNQPADPFSESGSKRPRRRPNFGERFP
jgi:hypothetical protein